MWYLMNSMMLLGIKLNGLVNNYGSMGKSYIESKMATCSSLASVGLILTVFLIATKMIKKAIGFVIIGVILVVAVTYFKISGVF